MGNFLKHELFSDLNVLCMNIFMLGNSLCMNFFMLENSLSGADPGFFLGGGAPLRNDVTDGEVTKF